MPSDAVPADLRVRAGRVVAPLRDAAGLGSELGRPGGDVGRLPSGSRPARGAHVAAGQRVAGCLPYGGGADVVVDVSNSPSFADDDVMAFFVTATTNLLEAEKKAGVKHHVALSVVGTGTLPDSGYLRAKAAQEDLIGRSGVPYSVVRATQFFEFTKAIADASMIDGKLHLAPVHYQPIASDDVASVA